jgi:hypothetical protein
MNNIHLHLCTLSLTHKGYQLYFLQLDHASLSALHLTRQHSQDARPRANTSWRCQGEVLALDGHLNMSLIQMSDIVPVHRIILSMLAIPSTCDSMRYFVVLLDKVHSHYQATYPVSIVGDEAPSTGSSIECRRRLHSCLYLAFAGATISRGVWFKVAPHGNRLTHGDTKDTGQGARERFLRTPAARFLITELLPTPCDRLHTEHLLASYTLFANADPCFANGSSDIPLSTPLPHVARPPQVRLNAILPDVSSASESPSNAHVLQRDLLFIHLYGPSSNGIGVSPPHKVTAPPSPTHRIMN